MDRNLIVATSPSMKWRHSNGKLAIFQDEIYNLDFNFWSVGDEDLIANNENCRITFTERMNCCAVY